MGWIKVVLNFFFNAAFLADRKKYAGNQFIFTDSWIPDSDFVGFDDQ